MTPSDSHPSPATVMSSRRRLPRTVKRCRPLGWVSQVPRLICVDIRRPQPPRRARPLPLLVAWRSGIRLRLFRKVGHSRLLGFNEAESGSLALRLTSSHPRASTARLPVTPPGSFMVNEQFPWSVPFHLTRSARLGLAHRNEPNTTAGPPTDFAWRNMLRQGDAQRNAKRAIRAVAHRVPRAAERDCRGAACDVEDAAAIGSGRRLSRRVRASTSP